MDEEDYVASEEELMEVESSTATTEDMDDSGPSTPRLSMSLSPVKPLPKPKRKARGKAKGKRKVAKARQCSQDSQSELSQMEAADEPQNSRERSGMPKKHKELPKPVIPIYLHHPLPFKNAEYLRKKRSEDDEKSPYRLLKHIVAQEKGEWEDDRAHPSYWTVRAPPRSKPAKKYSDISGLEAKYTDPETRLHYADAEEFQVCRSLTRDLVQSYLRLRGFVDIIG